MVEQLGTQRIVGHPVVMGQLQFKLRTMFLPMEMKAPARSPSLGLFQCPTVMYLQSLEILVVREQ
jgi:hypothetical protein